MTQQQLDLKFYLNCLLLI